jgi:hypothetical protein
MTAEDIINDEHPKIFISYAWTNQQHENWVRQLATDLRKEGIDAILDKWDLNPGNDTLPFMEQMVNDDTVKKVLMVCDKNYAEKANKRKGAVGIETQIISKKVYEQSNQNKFAALIREYDEDGNPCVPTYCHSRFYIDFADDAAFSERFKELVLWIYDKPIYPKPPLGPKSALLSENKIYSGTAMLQKKVIENITNGRGIAQGSIKEYFDEYHAKLELFRVKFSSENKFIEDLLHNLEQFRSFRDEFLSVISYISKYDIDTSIEKSIHKFFENLLSYLGRPDDVFEWYPAEIEIYKFIIYELFMCTLAILLKDENYDIISYLLNSKYFIPKQNILFEQSTLPPFNCLRNHCAFFDKIAKYKNEYYPQAVFLKERNEASGINFYYIMEADFICYLKAEILNTHWWPSTLIYLAPSPRPFELFAKSISAEYFENLTKIFGFVTITDIIKLLNEFSDNKRQPTVQGKWGFNIAALIGFEQLKLANELPK